MVMKRRVPGILENLLKNKEETRYANLAYVSIVLLTILSFRLFFMQIIEGSYYKQEADGNRIRTLPIIASRGVMYDRNGILMVGSRASYGITMPVDRKKNSLPETELRNLANLLKTSPAMLQKKIEDNKAIFGAIYLAKDVSLDVATEIEEKKNDYPDIEVEVQPVRVYPFGNAGAQMLGYVGEAGPEDVDKNGRPYASSTLIGRAGLEWQYNQYLEGTNGSKVIEVNAAGQPVNYTGGAAAISGNNIRLTVDSALQRAAENAVEAQVNILHGMGIFPTGASVVAVDTNIGGILAMVSWPSFDPNQFSRGISSEEWDKIINNKNHPLQNRNISSMYPPGSTFKVITGATALEAKMVTPEEKIFDNGRHWLIDKRNSEGEAFGWVDFYDAMAKSDNVYFYEMGRRVGIDRLAAMSRDFGLGQLTGIDLTGEVEGNVASEEYKKKIFGQDWYLGETFDAAIGQSFTLTTPLQMAMVYSALANGGFKYQPYLVSRVDHLDGTPKKIFSPKRIGSLPLSKATMDVVCEALRRVMQKGGTGGNLFENYPISIAGKSGTAETNGLDNGWFIAYGPFEKPEIVIACMFEHAGFGADSAAPVVKKVMDAYFHFGEYAFAKDRSGAVLRKKGN